LNFSGLDDPCLQKLIHQY